MHWKTAPLFPTWKPIVVHCFDDSPGLEGDFPSLSDFNEIPVLGQRAWDALKPLIGPYAEALPIQHPSKQPFYIVNVLVILNCLDEQRSELTRNEATGRVSRVYGYCFRKDVINDRPIFKTPLQSGSELFVSDEFRKIVEDNDLKGLLFKEL